MKKTIEIDEKAIYESVLAKLDSQYELAYVDYRDEVPVSLFQEALKKKSVTPFTEEDVYAESREYATRNIIEELLKGEGLDSEQIELFRTSEENDELRFQIQDRDCSHPEKDLVSRSKIHGYIFFNSNFDCWIDLYDQGGLWYEETALMGLLSVLSLNPRKVKEEAVRQGVAVHGRWPAYPKREGKEVVDYKQFVRCLRETPNYGNWCFFGVFDGKVLWEHDFNTADLSIPKGTTCCMFNSWNGGGSMDFCKTLRALPLKEIESKQKAYIDGYKILIDEPDMRDNGYTPTSVYGGHLSEDNLLEE